VKWSYSSLKDFINCPRQYHEVKVLQNFTKKVTEQMRYGSEVHKAMEDYVKYGKPLPKNYQRYQAVLDAVRAIPGMNFLEHKFAIDEEHKPCEFDDVGYWVRGIVDFLSVDGDTAYIIDYKTGNDRYADTKQLKLMAILTLAHFPEVRRIKAGLLFVAKNNFIHEEYSHVEEGKSYLWSYFEPDLRRLQKAFEDDFWPAQQSGLCGWCPVHSCQYHKVR